MENDEAYIALMIIFWVLLPLAATLWAILYSTEAAMKNISRYLPEALYLLALIGGAVVIVLARA